MIVLGPSSLKNLKIIKILDQFIRSKLSIIFVIFIFSCTSQKELNRKNISTEIICQDGKKILVRFAYAQEVKKAIENHINRKLLTKTEDKFTVIRIPRIESFHVPKIPPEELIKCQIIDNQIYKAYPNYIRRFK